uniref:EndoU domain-containing protein n=1 Tax=Leclercia sp. EC_58 TaxID=2584090 RepID=UPI0028162242|nr:EndoU domain-containing protein [Leclercia sp. EC_58]
MADISMSQASLGASMIKDGATPDEIAAALVKNAQGDMPEGLDAIKGLLTAWGEFFGVPVSALTTDGEMTPQQAAEILASGVPTSEAKLIQYVAAKAILSVAKSSDLGLSPANQKYVDILSPEAKQHILYEDNLTSGGHLYPGNPGKTVFPQQWSADKVVHEIGDITTSPNTQWYAQTGTGGIYTSKGKPANWVSYETRDGVRIRVVYQPATGKVVTAFPDNAPIPNSYKSIK